MSRGGINERGGGAGGLRPGRPEFAQLRFGSLTWLGLSLALIGWMLLIAVAAMADALIGRLARSPVLHDDLLAIAQALVASGFALAAIGTLRAGFGALDRFFGAVLSRSGARAETYAAGPPPGTAFAQPSSQGYGQPPGQPYGRAAGPTLEMPPQRPYRTYPDGSVEVETILGTRRFATMGDARAFI